MHSCPASEQHSKNSSLLNTPHSSLCLSLSPSLPSNKCYLRRLYNATIHGVARYSRRSTPEMQQDQLVGKRIAILIENDCECTQRNPPRTHKHTGSTAPACAQRPHNTQTHARQLICMLFPSRRFAACLPAIALQRSRSSVIRVFVSTFEISELWSFPLFLLLKF